MEILILTSRFGQGHYQAAKALEEELCRQQESEVQLKDMVKMLWPQRSERIYQAYSLLVGGKAPLFRMVYARGKESRELPLWLERQQLRFYEILDRFFMNYKPDLMISTYSMASRFLSGYKMSRGIDIPLITCITDLGAHHIWVNPGTDLYLVAAEETALELRNYGVDPACIHVTGIPVAKRYRDPAASNESDREGILMMGGGLGLLPEKKSFYKTLSESKLSVTVICGKNQKLFRKLNKMHLPNIHVVGYTKDVKSYMKRANVLVSKPGGITTFEAIHTGTPLICLKPQLEQEKSNARFLKNHGLGYVLRSDKPNPKEILSLLARPEQLRQSRERMEHLKEDLLRFNLNDELQRRFPS